MKTPSPVRALSALVLAALVGALPVGACSSSDHSGPTDAGTDGTVADADAGPIDAGPDIPIIQPDAMPPSGAFCALPGTYVWTAKGPEIVPGANTPPPDLSWLTLPQGYCAHYFGHVPTARQIRIAPDGDVFVASPTTSTTGGANNGIAGIVVLPDDDHDGTADQNITFLDNLPSVQGLLFTGGYFYYQDNTIIRRVPFHKGDRKPSGASTNVTTMSMKQATEHWPKVMDIAQDGTIYVTNGGSQFDACESNFQTYAGGVYKLNPDGSTSMVTNGFRNPIALRCETDHDVCLAVELALDYSWNEDGREKIMPVRQGDNWGYPCCATQNTPYTGVTYADTKATPDCSNVAPESASFLIGHTPFGIDFENGLWPAPWGGRAFVTLHGDAARWEGARIVGIALDPATGLPLPSTDLDGGSSAPNMIDFATGWDDGAKDHGRPAAITFAPDGRMFLGDDQKGYVLWIAPVALMQH